MNSFLAIYLDNCLLILQIILQAFYFIKMLAFNRNYCFVCQESVNLFKYFQFLQKILQNYEERKNAIFYFNSFLN